jgi:hypothetical protein
MSSDRIDFISAYCDRWCERCPFTARCSTFAVEAAAGMCGDFREGLELAVGRPMPVRGATEPAADAFVAPAHVEITAQERAEFNRREHERDARSEATSVMAVSWAAAMVAHRWARDRYEVVRAAADAVVREALDIAMWDASLISAKVHRALHGRDRFREDGDGDDDPVQNDWNGSAKVALMCVERSEAAWRVIAQSTGDETPALLADQLNGLRRMILEEFPDAPSFVRPGFDEPGR